MKIQSMRRYMKTLSNEKLSTFLVGAEGLFSEVARTEVSRRKRIQGRNLRKKARREAKMEARRKAKEVQKTADKAA